MGRGLNEAESMFKGNEIPPRKLPVAIKLWCEELFSARPHLKVSSFVSEQICAASHGLFAKRPYRRAYSEDYSRSREFCLHLSGAFDTLLGHQETESAAMKQQPVPV